MINDVGNFCDLKIVSKDFLIFQTTVIYFLKKEVKNTKIFYMVKFII